MLKNQVSNLNTNWKELLNNYLDKNPNIDLLYKKETEEYTIYPKKEDIFSAFNKFNIEDLKVVIIGQDPYHQKNQAHGMCFSVNENIKIPPSLRNIFKEINNNYNKNHKFKNGNLEYLANQGILLLNNTLTVRDSHPNSHLKIWNGFSKYIIEHIVNGNNNIIFMLWGNNAKNIKKNITTINLKKHYFLESNHPSPLSANRGNWFNLNQFKKCNEILKDINKKEINWFN